MNQVVTFLKQVKATIATPETWCQYRYAKNKDGERVFIDDPQAVQWCLSGAMRLIDHDQRSPVYKRAYGYLTKIGHDGTTGFNDTHTHSEVLALLDRVVEYSTGLNRFKFWKRWTA